MARKFGHPLIQNITFTPENAPKVSYLVRRSGDAAFDVVMSDRR